MTVKERWRWAEMRMRPTGLSVLSGVNYTYLMNGFAPDDNWTALFQPGERVRLRIINASAATYYDVRVPGLKLSVVHVHGNDVEPVEVDEFRIGVAETYDVIVEPKDDQAYSVFAQDMGRTGYARGTLAPRPGMDAPVPPMDDRPLRGMADMGMAAMAPKQIDASREDRSRLGGLMGKQSMEVVSDLSLLPGQQPTLPRPEAAESKPGVEELFIADKLIDRLKSPGDGLNHLDRRVLTYADLRSRKPGLDKPPAHTRDRAAPDRQHGALHLGLQRQEVHRSGPDRCAGRRAFPVAHDQRHDDEPPRSICTACGWSWRTGRTTPTGRICIR